MSLYPLAVLREAVAFAQSERGASPADIDRDQAEDDALAQVEAMAKSMARLWKSFPEEIVFLDAGWDGVEVDEACEAYDEARRVLAAFAGETP